MKATTIIIAAALTLSVNVLFASNDNASAPLAKAIATLTLLAPTVPMEATFEDAVDMTDFASLAPVTPTEASIDEMNYEMVSALNLAPIVPLSAEVEESDDFSSLAPIVPAEADFE